MANQKKKKAGVSTTAPSKLLQKKPSLKAIGSYTAAPMESPARALMQRLELEHRLVPEYTNDMWSTRRSFAFIATTCVILWFGFYLMATTLF